MPYRGMFTMLSRAKLEDLVTSDDGPWVTLSTPLHGGGPFAKQDQLAFRRLIEDARSQLEARADLNGEARVIVEELEEILGDREIFRAGARGLVVLASPQRVERWHLPNEIEPRAVVDARPHVETLLPLASSSAHFYAVSLTLHGTRLFSCDRHAARELPLPEDAPARLEDAAGWDIEEQHLQYHPTTPSLGSPRHDAPMYHAQGGGTDDRDVDIEKYLRAIDAALWEAIPHRDAPIVLMSTENVEGIFRRITRLPRVCDAFVHGSFDHAELDEIHARAWPVVEPLFQQRLTRDLERFRDARGTGLTAERLDEVVLAAWDGRVDTLFVRRGGECAGVLDERRREVRTGDALRDGEVHTDLCDRAAADSLAKGGTIHVVDDLHVPFAGPVGAILRW